MATPPPIPGLPAVTRGYHWRSDCVGYARTWDNLGRTGRVLLTVTLLGGESLTAGGENIRVVVAAAGAYIGRHSH